MIDDTIKLRFLLTDSRSAGFPVTIESLWCIKENDGYRVKNAPFFINGISFDDLISVRTLDSGEVQLNQVIQPSGNSTLWLNFPKPELAKDILNTLTSLGCGTEGGVFPGYYSINIPQNVDIQPIFDLLDSELDKGIVEVNYPSIRHAA
ncbi:MAG: DUF4265 domain-containing protein [Steroidobacter sp.]